jgi:hypothetical protein
LIIFSEGAELVQMPARHREQESGDHQQGGLPPVTSAQKNGGI